MALTAIALGTIAVSAYAASTQAGAAEDAARIQSEAAGVAAQKDAEARQKALELQQQQMARAQANAQPYLDVGRGATSTLSRLMGFAPGTTASGGFATAPTAPAFPPPPSGSRMRPRNAEPAGSARFGTDAFVPQEDGEFGGRQTTLASIGRMPTVPVPRVAPSPALGGPSAGMVTLQAPTGARRQFPRGSAEHQQYLARGAVEVQ